MFTNSYNSQRQLLLVQRQFSLSQQSWYIAAGVIAGLLLIASALGAVFAPAELPEVQGFYLAVFTFGGLIFTSQVFKELHSPLRSYFYLTLPASSLEKLAGAWLITSPLYIVSFTLVSFIIFFLSFLIAGVPFSLSYFFNQEMGESILSYMVIQTVFLWGAVYFRKNNFLKTALAIIVLGIALGLYTGGLITALLDWPEPTTTAVESIETIPTPGEEATYIEQDGQMVQITHKDWPEMNAFVNNVLEPTLNFFFWGLLGPYMLLMAYFTLKEREI